LAAEQRHAERRVADKRDASVRPGLGHLDLAHPIEVQVARRPEGIKNLRAFATAAGESFS
jgi:hypothetical protein